MRRERREPAPRRPARFRCIAWAAATVIGPLAILARLMVPAALAGSFGRACAGGLCLLGMVLGLSVGAVLAALGVAITAAGAGDRPARALLGRALAAGAALAAAAMLPGHLPEALGERHEDLAEMLPDAVRAGAFAGVAGALTACLALLIARRCVSLTTH